jgi:hypothetical protein
MASTSVSTQLWLVDPQRNTVLFKDLIHNVGRENFDARPLRRLDTRPQAKDKGCGVRSEGLHHPVEVTDRPVERTAGGNIPKGRLEVFDCALRVA